VYRAMSLFTGTLLAIAPILSGQESQSQSGPGSPEETLSARQLIVWTWMQQPQPMPAPNNSIPAADQNPDQRARGAQQIFIGKIARIGERLILTASNGNAYPLNRQEVAQRYEGKNVRISGTLNTADHTIEIIGIELLS
jgi:hypothetical protein